ncbi:MAG: gliding motility-associated protein GldE [Rikenellaceae bacterium]
MELITIDHNTIIYAIILVILLALSAFVSGSEAAFFSLTHVDIDNIKKSNSKRSNTIISLIEKQDELLSTILIVNNLVNISAVVVANSLIDSIFKFNSTLIEFIVKTVIVTFLLLLFGEIMPKIASTRAPLKAIKLTAMPLEFLRKILKPLSYVLINSSSHINELTAHKKGGISIEQLSEALEIAPPNTAEDKKILTGIVKFVNTEVSDIMRNRVDIVALDITCDFKEIKETIVSSGYSRLPIYKDDIDNIKGVLYVKDLLQYVDEKELKWQKLIRPAYFIHEQKKINNLLEEFQTNQVHLAIVVDEYGSTKGAVSLEDILEEVVGEISDETDAEERSLYTKVGDNTFIFEAKTHLSDFIRILNINETLIEPSRGEAETLAGLMLEVKHDFLKSGDIIEIANYKFTVIKINGRRIEKIKVERQVVEEI